MDLGLSGRVAIVTGSSRGIGRGIALALAREGVKVVITARGAADLSEVKSEIERIGGEGLAVAADLTDPENVKVVVDSAVESFGQLDILVNNVGGAIKFGGLFELCDDDWQAAFNLNVMPVVYCVRNAFPWLRASSAARIINISSISGIEPGMYNPHYAITKAAVINLSKCMANELVKYGVLVNVVCPGPVYSDAWERNVRRLAESRNISTTEAELLVDAEESAKIPVGRIGEWEDVAGLVVFLASDRSTWIAGSCFHVNGGKLRSIC